MMSWPQINLVMIPKEEWEELKRMQAEILQQLKEQKDNSNTNSNNNLPAVSSKHITAIEFMDAVRIRRTKFDQLVQTSKIKIIRKGRKIYLPVSEVDRYFNDNSIQ